MDQMVLLDKLDKLEILAKGSKVKRLFYSPLRYISGILYTKFIYPFSKKGKVETVQTIFGDKMEVVLPAGMDIYLLGVKTHSSELRLARFLIKNLVKGNTFIDVGAHFGFFSKLASKLVGEKGKVHSLEASENIFTTLKRNISQNANIQAHHLAVSNEKGKISFFEFPILYSEYNTIYPDQFEKSNWYRAAQAQKTLVNTTPLDALQKKLKFDPQIIKIDVEGAEYEVIKGMESLMATSDPLIIMEYLFGERSSENYESAVKLAVQRGYTPHFIEEDGSLLQTNVLEIKNKSGLDSDNIVLKKN